MGYCPFSGKCFRYAFDEAMLDALQSEAGFEFIGPDGQSTFNTGEVQALEASVGSWEMAECDNQLPDIGEAIAIRNIQIAGFGHVQVLVTPPQEGDPATVRLIMRFHTSEQVFARDEPKTAAAPTS